MSSQSSLLCLFAAAAGTACTSSVTLVEAPGSVSLKVGQEVAIAGEPYRVRFDSMISDSRCPAGTLCIQAGEALLAMELSSPLFDSSVPDNPHFQLGLAPVTFQGHRYTQLAVSPAPRPGVQIDPKTYVVKILIQ